MLIGVINRLLGISSTMSKLPTIPPATNKAQISPKWSPCICPIKTLSRKALGIYSARRRSVELAPISKMNLSPLPGIPLDKFE